MSSRIAIAGVAISVLLSGCSHGGSIGEALSGVFGERDVVVADATPEAPAADPGPVTVAHAQSWGDPATKHPGFKAPKAVADTDGPYLLDTGDRLRVFVYGQPNLSRLYTVDHDGKITVPLIGQVKARGVTTQSLEGAIRSRLGAQYVKDPQVTVDIQQNRPFFILGEVRSAGQFPYVSGMTIETAVAIAGGYSERANERKARITRRINGLVEVLEVPPDYVVQPGDTVYVYERIF
jgi:polysaccharide export outer membrane protein